MVRSSFALPPLALVPVLLTGRAMAQEPAMADFAPARLTLSAEPSLWYVAPGGNIRFPTSTGAATEIVNAGDLNMDSPRLSPFIELNINSPTWGATFRAMNMSARSRDFTTAAALQLGDSALASGTVARSSLNWLQLEAEARLAIFPYWKDQAETRETKHWQTFDHRFDVVAGLRLIDFSFDVSRDIANVATPVASAESTYIMPYAGFKGSAIIEEQLTIDLTSNFGGIGGFDGKTAFNWDILVGFQYHITPHFGAQIGYRQLLFRLGEDDTDFQWNGAQAGLYFGLVGRF
jgi:hypothetical protein